MALENDQGGQSWVLGLFFLCFLRRDTKCGGGNSLSHEEFDLTTTNRFMCGEPFALRNGSPPALIVNIQTQ